MKITGVESFVVSTFHRNAKRNWLVFKLLTDEDVFGLGDASLHAFNDQVIGILEEWVDRYLVGKDPMHHELHWTRLHRDTWARGGAIGSTVLSGLDIAMWDLKGKILNRPFTSCWAARSPTGCGCTRTAGTPTPAPPSRTPTKPARSSPAASTP